MKLNINKLYSIIRILLFGMIFIPFSHITPFLFFSSQGANQHNKIFLADDSLFTILECKRIDSTILALRQSDSHLNIKIIDSFRISKDSLIKQHSKLCDSLRTVISEYYYKRDSAWNNHSLIFKTIRFLVLPNQNITTFIGYFFNGNDLIFSKTQAALWILALVIIITNFIRSFFKLRLKLDLILCIFQLIIFLLLSKENLILWTYYFMVTLMIMEILVLIQKNRIKTNGKIKHGS